MKYQNPSLFFFLNGRMDKPKPICSLLFQSRGHNNHCDIVEWSKDTSATHVFTVESIVCINIF